MDDRDLKSAAAEDLTALYRPRSGGAVDLDQLVGLEHLRRFVANLIPGGEVDVDDPTLLRELLQRLN